MPSLVLSALAYMCLGHVTVSLFFLAQSANTRIPTILYPLIRLDSAKHATMAWVRWKLHKKAEDYECYLAFRRFVVAPWVLNDDQTIDPHHAPTDDPLHVRV